MKLVKVIHWTVNYLAIMVTLLSKGNNGKNKVTK
jgi:hypothetical protein